MNPHTPISRPRIRKSLFLSVFFTLLISVPFVHAQTGAESKPINPDPAVASDEPASTNITLDFKDADINTVLRIMSIKSKVNIVAGPEVQGNVTIRLEDVPWEKALEVVLRTYGYVYERDGNIIRVTTRENLAQEPVMTQTYILNYTKATEIQLAVQDMLTERGRIKVAERTNTIVITDIPTNLYRIGEIIKKLDHMTPQAFIDSKVVNTQLTRAENLGIEWKTGGANNLGSLTGSSRPTTFPFTDFDRQMPDSLRQFFAPVGTSTSATQNTVNPRSFPIDLAEPNPAFSYGTLSFSGFNAVLQLLKTRTSTKVVSNPRIVVLNNQTAKVQVGQQIPLPTFERNQTTGTVEVTGYSYRDIGVVLNVTPHINNEAEILVDLKPEVSSQGDTVDFGTFQIPSFNVTQAATQVLIRSGETIAIGGLLTDNTQTAENKIPYFSDLPIFGKLFRSKRQDSAANTKAETLFFVTVTMVDTEGQPYNKSEEEKKKQTAASKASALKGNAKVASSAASPASASLASGSAANAQNETAQAPAIQTETQPEAEEPAQPASHS